MTMNRLLVGALASAATLSLAFGRTQVVAATIAKPMPVPIADHVDPAAIAGPRTALAWPSRVPDRLLEVLYVYSNRTPTATHGARRGTLPGRDEDD